MNFSRLDGVAAAALGPAAGSRTQAAERISRPMAARELRRLSIVWDRTCMGWTDRDEVAMIGRNTALTIETSATETITSTTVMPASPRALDMFGS